METNKDTKGKYRPSLVPLQIIKCIARVREYGVQKYKDPNNWKTVRVEDLKDAMMRHMVEYMENSQSRDRESGLPHLWHVATNCAFLCVLEVFCDE